jgi:hypothetical protein
MRKLWTAAMVAAAVGTSVLATAAVASAQDSRGDRNDAAARTCVGTWDGSVQIGPVTRNLLVAFTKEGIVHVAEAAAQSSSVPGGADVEFNSPGLGAYRNSQQGCSLTIKVLSNNAQGADSGFAIISGTVKPAQGGKALSGTLSFTTTLPDGGGAGPIPVTFEGTRVVAP